MSTEPDWSAVASAPPPPMARVYARARRNKALRLAQGTAGALAVAAVALFLLQPGEGGRDRGVGRVPLVALEAVAEGPQGAPRPLSDGGSVGPSERVVFFVRASAPGEALLREHGPAGTVVVWPAEGSWALSAGEHTPGEEQPLSWRPDAGPGAYRYELQVCAEPEDCASSWLTLVWAP